jgi:hypothetical protein
MRRRKTNGNIGAMTELCPVDLFMAYASQLQYHLVPPLCFHQQSRAIWRLTHSATQSNLAKADLYPILESRNRKQTKKKQSVKID